jgi:hypothetical protein
VKHTIVVGVFVIVERINGALWVYGTCLPNKPGLIYFPIVIIMVSFDLFAIIFVLGPAFRSTRCTLAPSTAFHSYAPYGATVADAIGGTAVAFAPVCRCKDVRVCCWVGDRATVSHGVN